MREILRGKKRIIDCVCVCVCGRVHDRGERELCKNYKKRDRFREEREVG